MTDAQRLMWRHRLTVKDLRKLALRAGKTLANNDRHFHADNQSGEPEKYEDVTIGANVRQELDVADGYQSLVKVLMSYPASAPCRAFAFGAWGSNAQQNVDTLPEGAK